MYPLMAITSGEGYSFNGVDLPRCILVDAAFRINMATGFNIATDNLRISKIRKIQNDQVDLYIQGNGVAWVISIPRTANRTKLTGSVDGSQIDLMTGDVTDFVDNMDLTTDWLLADRETLFEPSCIMVEPPLVQSIEFYNDPRPEMVSEIPEYREPTVGNFVEGISPDSLGRIMITPGVNSSISIADGRIVLTPLPGGGMGRTFQSSRNGNVNQYPYSFWYNNVFKGNRPCEGILYFNGVSPNENGRLDIYGGSGFSVEQGDENTLILRVTTTKRERCD